MISSSKDDDKDCNNIDVIICDDGCNGVDDIDDDDGDINDDNDVDDDVDGKTTLW